MYRPQAPPNTRTGPSHWWPVLPRQGSGSPPCETRPSSQSPQQLSSAGFHVSSPPAPGSLRPKGPWSHCPHGHQSLSTWAFRVSAFTAGELLSSTPAFPWEAPSTEGKGPRSQAPSWRCDPALPKDGMGRDLQPSTTGPGQHHRQEKGMHRIKAGKEDAKLSLLTYT